MTDVPKAGKEHWEDKKWSNTLLAHSPLKRNLSSHFVHFNSLSSFFHIYWDAQEGLSN